MAKNRFPLTTSNTNKEPIFNHSNILYLGTCRKVGGQITITEMHCNISEPQDTCHKLNTSQVLLTCPA